MDLNDIASLREGNRLEAKFAKGGLPKSMWETYSAFANSSGGTILLGVEEDKATGELHPVGISNPQAVLDDLWNTANNPQKVSANVLSDAGVTVVRLGGTDVIRIDVPRADRKERPVFLNDNPKRCFRRNHSGDYLCSYGEVRAMMRDAAERSQDLAVMERVGMEELDRGTVDSYRRRYRDGHPGHAWNEYGDDTFLRAIGAAGVGEDGQLHPTMAGLLMFGVDWRICEELPEYFLDYRQETSPDSRWQDRVVSKGGDWPGNVYGFYYRAYSCMRQALKVPFKLDGVTRVDDTPAHRALREALANALTNANYRERRGVVCVWREDALTISNPGDFRIGLERAMQPGESDPRNAALLAMFSYIDVGERAGSGLPAIMGDWAACGYDAPSYTAELGPDRTTLTLPLSGPETIADEPTAASSGGALQGLSDRERLAVEMASGKGFVTTGALAAAAGVSKQTASETLRSLSSRGVLSWVGKNPRDPHQRYVLP